MSEDDRGGMTDEECVEFVVMNIKNGNFKDAINFIMRDGDIRADSVKLALRVASAIAVNDYTPIQSVTNRLIRYINTWERT